MRDSYHFRARLFHQVDRYLGRIAAGVKAVHQGIWLGVLDRQMLREATELQYSAWVWYRDVAYNASGFSSWESDVADRYFSDCRTVLVASVGGGREVAALAKRGITVDGFECNPTLVEFSRTFLQARGCSGTVTRADPDRVPPVLGRYDGAVIGWGAYMHIPGRHNRVRFLGEVRAHLIDHAPLLVSFFTRDHGPTFYRWIRNTANVLRWARRSPERIELGDTLSGSYDHRFTREEIESELRQARFEPCYYNQTPYGHAVARAISTSITDPVGRP